MKIKIHICSDMLERNRGVAAPLIHVLVEASYSGIDVDRYRYRTFYLYGGGRRKDKA
jgi:hypothetical protein